MKKQLLSIIASVSTLVAVAQPSPSWMTNQQAVFPTAPSTAVPGIRYMDAVDQNVVWVVGYDGTAFNRHYNWFSKTTNGGTSWSGGNILADTMQYAIANLEGIDGNTAWVSAYDKTIGNGGGGAIFRTVNGGTSWQNMTASGMYTNSASFCNIVSFFTPSVGITQGDPNNGGFEIWRTTNGGLSWSQLPQTNIPAPLTNEFAIINLYYKLGTSNLWFGTNAGRMYRTTNAGVTWSVSTVAAGTATLLEIAFSTPNNGICYVWNGASTDVYNSFDGGVTWNMITPNGPIGYADVCGVPGTGVLASFGSGQNNQVLSYSTDNGLNWTDWGSAGIQYLCGDFVDASTGWAGGFDIANIPITNIWKYTDVAITGTSVPLASFSMPVSLCGPNATVMPVNSTSATPAPTYSWSSNPAGVIFSSSTASAPVMTFPNNTTYTISLLVTNSSGTNVSQQVVTVDNCVAPTASFTIPSVNPCLNIEFLTMNSSFGGTPAPSYSWSASSSNITFSPSTVADSPTLLATAPGVYTITLVATNNVGSVSATQTVQVVSCSPTASFTLNKTLIHYCDIPDRKIGTLNKTAVVPGAGNNTYTWSISPTNGVQHNTGFTVNNYSATITNSVLSTYTITLKTKNASGTSSTTATFSVSFDPEWCAPPNPDAIAENSLDAHVNVFPNPAHDVINVRIDAAHDNYNVTLVNILGTVVYEDKAVKTDSVSINMQNKPRGVYFLTVQNGVQKTTRKIIVE